MILTLLLSFPAVAPSKSSPALRQSELQPGRYVQTMTFEGLVRSYIMDVPPAAASGKELPLVVVLHGLGSSGAAAELNTGMGAESRKQGFVAVFPDGLGKPRGWNAGFVNRSIRRNVDDIGFVGALMNEVEERVKIDLNEQYVVGNSNGALLANAVGAKYSSRIAAIAAVSGTIGVHLPSGDKVIPFPDAPLSVLMICAKHTPALPHVANSRPPFKDYGPMECAEWWADKNGDNPEPDVATKDGGNLKIRLFVGGRDNAVVELVTMERGRRVWPAGPKDKKRDEESKVGINVADLIWHFFRKHPKGA